LKADRHSGFEFWTPEPDSGEEDDVEEDESVGEDDLPPTHPSEADPAPKSGHENDPAYLLSLCDEQNLRAMLLSWARASDTAGKTLETTQKWHTEHLKIEQ
jgi:hypothetical protein